MEIRIAGDGDAAGIQAIYAPLVLETPISFETEPPTVAEMGARVADTLPGHPWLVLVDGGRILGYAYGHRFSDRAAYLWSVETSIYVGAGSRGRGAGRALYATLLALLRAQGYRQAFAGVALPNPASVTLHERFGFEAMGVYRRVGWKLGAWHDVGWWQLGLEEGGARPDPPPTPVPVDHLSPGTVEKAASLGLAQLRL